MRKAQPQWVNDTKRKYQKTTKSFDYGTRQWKNFAKDHKRNSPYCAHCILEGKYKLGEVSDHIIPINRGGSVWDEANLQNLCRYHDNVKRSRESRGMVLPHIGDYGMYLPATSIDLEAFDVHWMDIIDFHFYNPNLKTIIIGPPAAGKTFWSDTISVEQGINISHTDDYINNPYDCVEQCKKIVNEGKAYHLEGNMAHLMLSQEEKYRPQAVYWIDIPDTVVYMRYKEMRDVKSYDHAIGNYYLRQKEALTILEDLKLFCYRYINFTTIT